MSTAKSTTTAKPAPALPDLKPLRLFPGLISRSVIALALVAIVFVRTLPRFEGVPAPWNDMALANILTLVFGFVAAITLVIWFCFLSSYSPLLCRIVLAGLPAMIGLFFVF